jgi:hypothetical protein
MQARLQGASRQQRSLYRIGRASGVERLLDFCCQAIFNRLRCFFRVLGVKLKGDLTPRTRQPTEK